LKVTVLQCAKARRQNGNGSLPSFDARDLT
jgi:hypothetical protein